MTNPTTTTVNVRPDLPITLSEAGTGRPVLVLHGGGGPATVAPIAAHLSQRRRAIAPVNPGWNGSARPDWCTGIGDIADAFLDVLRERDLRDVVLVGNSIGGWVAAEMAIRDEDAARVSGVVLIDAVGVDIPGRPIRDFFALNPTEVAEYSFHDSDKFMQDPSTQPPAAQAQQAANMQTLRVYAGDPYMHDPALLDQLSRVTVPVAAMWGDSDRIVTPDYGRAYAEAFPNATFQVITDAGHLPQLEQPAATFALLDEFLDGPAQQA